jgi:hypothetical protein
MNTIISRAAVLLSSSLRRTLVRPVRYSASRTTKAQRQEGSLRKSFVLLCVLSASVVQTNAHQY